MKYTTKPAKAIYAFIAVAALTTGASAINEADCLYHYNDGARRARGGDANIRSAIAGSVARMNKGMSNSRTNTSIRSVGAEFLDLNDRKASPTSGDIERQHSALERGIIPGQRAREVAKDADLVTFVTNGGPDRGPGIFGKATLPGAYMVMDASGLLGAPLMTHETGHNYNGVHEQSLTATLPGGAKFSTYMLPRIDLVNLSFYSNPSVSTTEQGRTFPVGTAALNNAKRVRDIGPGRSSRRRRG